MVSSGIVKQSYKLAGVDFFDTDCRASSEQNEKEY